MLKLLPQWNNLEVIDRKIILAVCFDESPELARRNLRLNKRLFYDRWKHLKSFYLSLLDNLPMQVINNLRSYGKPIPPVE